MLLRALFMLVLALGCHAGLAAEPASAADADAAATSSADATDSTDTEPDAAEADAGDDEPAGSLDGEGFVPSVQISEDLSVSFPTDI